MPWNLLGFGPPWVRRLGDHVRVTIKGQRHLKQAEHVDHIVERRWKERIRMRKELPFRGLGLFMMTGHGLSAALITQPGFDTCLADFPLAHVHC